MDMSTKLDMGTERLLEHLFVLYIYNIHCKTFKNALEIKWN